MNNRNIKINKLILNNFKNVKNGAINFDTNVIGVYGQNGSGKTALVDACKFLKIILSGGLLPPDTYNYISVFEDTANITVDFDVKIQEKEYMVSYFVALTKEENKAIISKEKLSYKPKDSEKWEKKKDIVDYDITYSNLLKPKVKFKNIFAKEENIINLKVEQRICKESGKSFIFNDRTRDIALNQSLSEISTEIISSLTYFARCNLFVISNENNGLISINSILPVQFRKEENNQIISGGMGIGITGPQLVSKETFDLLKTILQPMNTVLGQLVPDLQLKVFDYGEELGSNGALYRKVELTSVKGDKVIPIRYESAGIKKIISILSALISMYNNPSVCLIIDELDAGIFEFLLGELLETISSSGKGQLLFTSHNLRPLEMLGKDSFYITTTNESNRYIKFISVKEHNNLRDLYIRSINLGGQKEEVYKETDQFEIQRAFRLAGGEHDRD